MFSDRRIRIILVNTSHPGNIGASARAMKNMGLSELVLVQPEEFPSGVAVGRAASALDLLENARVVATLSEAVADCGLIIGTSARSRSLPWPMLSPAQCGEKAVAESRKHPVALVFGREDSGLNNEELQLCHYHTQIPTNPGYSSLNLAAAVLLISYELHQAALAMDAATNNAATGAAATAAESEANWDVERASGEQVEHFFAHLERALIAIDFHDPQNPRQLMQRLRRLFSRVRLDTMEINILRGILTHIEKHRQQSDD